MTVCRRPDIATELERSFTIDGVQFYLYGDRISVLRTYQKVRFRSGSLTEEQKAFNKLMSACRVAVEWAFQYIKKYFACVDTPRKIGIKNIPAGLWQYVTYIPATFEFAFTAIKARNSSISHRRVLKHIFVQWALQTTSKDSHAWLVASLLARRINKRRSRRSPLEKGKNP